LFGVDPCFQPKVTKLEKIKQLSLYYKTAQNLCSDVTATVMSWQQQQQRRSAAVKHRAVEQDVGTESAEGARVAEGLCCNGRHCVGL